MTDLVFVRPTFQPDGFELFIMQQGAKAPVIIPLNQNMIHTLASQCVEALNPKFRETS